MPDEQERAAALLREPLEEGHALRVGPVQIVEHDDARHREREVADDLEPEAHPFVGRPRGIGEQLEPVVVLRLPAVEGVEEQLERPAERSGIGLTGVHDHRGRQALDQLAHEPGLADAALSTDERDRRGLPGVDEPGEPVELIGATDHLR